MSPSGDLWQEYKKNGTTYTITPNYEELQPTLQVVVMSSRVAEGAVTISSSSMVEWYFNDVKLTFSNNLSTNS
jgi:hypothetical protein